MRVAEAVDMVLPPTIAFVGVEPSQALREYALSKIGSTLHGDVIACRVVLEAHSHSHVGARFRAKVEIDVPHAVVIVGSAAEVFGDLYAAIDDSADLVKRALRDRSDRSRSQRAV